MTHFRSTAHLYEVQGYGRPNTGCRRRGRRWVPLYQYRDARMARAIMAHLIENDVPDLKTYEFEDFRVVPPDDRASFDTLRKQARKARRAGSQPPRSTLPATARQRRILGRSGVALRDAGLAVKVGSVHHREDEGFATLNLQHARRVGR